MRTPLYFSYHCECLIDCVSLFIDSDFKNLRSLEICGGGLTDAGVKNIKDLSSLTVLNLSQNNNLTDKSLEMISGILFIPSTVLYSPLKLYVPS